MLTHSGISNTSDEHSRPYRPPQSVNCASVEPVELTRSSGGCREVGQVGGRRRVLKPCHFTVSRSMFVP